jgi:hypothetical protein
MAEKFLATCKDQSVNRLLLVRHANAMPLTGVPRRADDGSVVHDWKYRDQTRGLSPKGIVQTSENRHLIEGIAIKANLTSPARRAADTAARMTISESSQREEKGGEVMLRMVESLHPAGMSTICEDLFDSMGYGPLRKFFDAPDGKEAFLAYGQQVCAELSAKAGGPAMSAIDSGDTLAMYGHAVFLNAVCYVIAAEAGITDLDFLLDVDLGEAEAIYIDLGAKTIKHLK